MGQGEQAQHGRDGAKHRSIAASHRGSGLGLGDRSTEKSRTFARPIKSRACAVMIYRSSCGRSSRSRASDLLLSHSFVS